MQIVTFITMAPEGQHAMSDNLSAESTDSGANSSDDESDTVIGQMLDNHEADSWRDLSDGTDYQFDDEHVVEVDRLAEYVDYCFETYDLVSRHLDRPQVQTCVADWDSRRGQARYNTTMDKQEFGKRVQDSKYRNSTDGLHTIFIATALVGVPPEDDNGVGWKACVRHELGHLIDYEKRGASGHGPKFKAVMDQFGEERNDGMSTHGYAPKYHR